jgi:hypothetical protein
MKHFVGEFEPIVGEDFMAKKQNPKLKNLKAKDAFSKNPEYRDILAITKRSFGEPVKRSDRFINANTRLTTCRRQS